MEKKKLLGKRLKELRKAKGWTLAKLGEMIGIEPSSLGNIENGYNYPKVSTLEELAKALDCKIGDFFNFEHLDTTENLIDEIREKLSKHPEKISDIYKIINALTD